MTQPSHLKDATIIRPEDADSKIPRASQLFSEAVKAQLCVTIIAGDQSNEAKRQRAKRRHDLKAALRTLHFMEDALNQGYRFDDQLAQEKIAAIGRAIRVLENEAQFLDQILTMD